MNFFAFCLVYSIVFVLIAWKVHSETGWIRLFRELITSKEILGSLGMNILRKIPIISTIFEKSLLRSNGKQQKVFDE
jgi:uncharacterized membrane protein